MYKIFYTKDIYIKYKNCNGNKQFYKTMIGHFGINSLNNHIMF